jgi:hypothetical protein
MDLDTPGKRIIFTRNLAGLTRKEMQEKYDIPVITLRSWEIASEIKEKAVSRFISALQKEGIECGAHWIMYGEGTAPCLSNVSTLKLNNIDILGNSFDKEVTEEIAKLKQKNKKLFSTMVKDDDNYPFLTIGDYVAGIIITDHKQMHHQLCIVEDRLGSILIRQLIPTKKPNSYHLKALNSEVEYPILYNQSIKQASKITWIRKRP